MKIVVARSRNSDVVHDDQIDLPAVLLHNIIIIIISTRINELQLSFDIIGGKQFFKFPIT